VEEEAKRIFMRNLMYELMLVSENYHSPEHAHAIIEGYLNKALENTSEEDSSEEKSTSDKE
jgi:hypothetical protein